MHSLATHPADRQATGQLTFRLTSELRPHPGVVRHGIQPAIQKTSTLVSRGESAFSDPLMVTSDGLILDGYARWMLARRQGREHLPCLTKDLSEEEALVVLLQAQQRFAFLNDFSRILLALDLEPHFRVTAKLNQQSGGRDKLSSDVTKARPVDVRQEIAKVARASTGNVNNVRVLLEKAAPEVVEALKAGEIRIGRAHSWLAKTRDGGRCELRHFRMKREMDAVSRRLLASHPAANQKAAPDASDLLVGFGPQEKQELLACLLSDLPESAVRQAYDQAGLCHAY